MMLPCQVHNTIGYGPTNMQAMLQNCEDVNQTFRCFPPPGEKKTPLCLIVLRTIIINTVPAN